jgi:hypothetical protein
MSATPRKIIFAEFNELCPQLLDRWMASGDLPNFKRLHDRSTVFTTQADVADPVNLEPWIQWYSLHTGLSFDQHKIFHLTEGAKAAHDDLWHIAHAAGRRVGSMASMNTRAFDFGDGSFYAADPWCEDGNASPPALNDYNKFVAAQVREYSNPDQKLSSGDIARFGWFMAKHGLRATTVAKIAGQLATERIKDKRLSWRRAALLDRLQFDVFAHYQRRVRPDFSTFFINSTAHLQHSYWRQFDPAPFSAKPDAEDRAIYGDAIRFGYRAMDALLADFVVLADKTGATLLFMTALSQQPYLQAEETGGKHFYRLRDVEAFFSAFDLPYAAIDPTMTHQYMVGFARDDERRAVRETLGKFSMADGRALFDFNDRTTDALYFSCNIFTPVASDSTIVTPAGTARRFADFLYKIDATKSGRHHPDGALWIAGGAHRHVDAAVSILDIFPTALDMMAIDRSRFVDRTGVSLAAQIACN